MAQESAALCSAFQDAESATSDDFLEAARASDSSNKSHGRSSIKLLLLKTVDRLSITRKSRKRRECNSTRNSTERRRLWWRRGAFACIFIVSLVVVLVLIWVSLTVALLQRLSPPISHNGLQRIISNWTDSSSPTAVLDPWPEDFSQDLVPIACHSHNDYWRHVPLYDALAAGCTGVEADIWLQNNDLYSEFWKTKNQNHSFNGTGGPFNKNGIFQMAPNTTLTLLLDVKTDGLDTWPLAIQQLEPLRERGFLTYFNGRDVVDGPITIVGSGNTPFELLISNNTYRDAFFDAPLHNLSNIYNKENSYYASVQLSQAVGKTLFGKLSTKQLGIIESQIDAARSRGLKSRYWDLPAWPVSARDHVWSALVARDVGMLNADDLVSVARWNWDWCTILGFNLC